MKDAMEFNGDETIWLVNLVRKHIARYPCSMSLTVLRKFMVFSGEATPTDLAAIDRFIARAQAREKQLIADCRDTVN